MCDPATISIAATAISTGMSVVQNIQQGKAAKAQANYQAAVARNNKILAGRAAERTEERGRREAAEVRQRNRALRGRQRAVLAAHGVDLGFGSAIDIEEGTALTGEVDALTFQERARREAEDLRFRGEMFGSEAELTLATGKTRQQQAYFNAAQSLATGTASVASKWQKYKTLPSQSSFGSSGSGTVQGI